MQLHVKTGFHMIVWIVPIAPVIANNVQRRLGRLYGNTTQTMANDLGD